MTTHAPAPHRNVLAFQYNGLAVLVPLMLITALTLNVVALSVPFMVIRAFGEGTEAYSILRTVSLMWQFKFHTLAILIVVFSVCFPFFKLFSMFLLWYLPINVRIRTRCLHILCSLGRWSLLDVFVSLVLIVLSHEQSLFVTSTRAGLPLFLIAICLSMGTGQLIAYLSQKVEGEPEITRKDPVRAAYNAGWRNLVVPILLLANLVALGAAIGIPYIKITAWYLHDNTYSILQTVSALFSDGKAIFALVVLVFLIVMPAARLVSLGVLWYWRFQPRQYKRAMEVTRDIRSWAMLDVFALSLLLFLAEGGRVIKVEQASGVWALLAVIVISQVLSIVTRRVIRNRLAQLTASTG